MRKFPRTQVNLEQKVGNGGMDELTLSGMECDQLQGDHEDTHKY